MKKEEIIERIIDTFTDMGCESPEDTAAGPIISLDEAVTYLAERRGMEQEDLNPEDWLPEETTPEMYMEAYNCYVMKCRHDYMKEAYIEWMKNVEPWDVYDDYCDATKTYKAVLPTEYLEDGEGFPFDDKYGQPNLLGCIIIGQNSSDFDPESQYCWYDDENRKIYGSSTPFKDGVIDCEPIAEWLLSDPQALDYVTYKNADTVPNCWPWEE